MTILAHHVHGYTTLRSDEYRCNRCGLGPYKFTTRRRPELCPDCRDVETMNEEDES